MRLRFLVWIALLAAPLNAQTAPGSPPLTPRQALQQAEKLFSQGHRFTAEEIRTLESLHDALIASGDPDFAAELDLLKLAAVDAAEAEEQKGRAQAALAEDTEQWNQREHLSRDQGFWRNVRNVGLVGFTVSTVATLLLAAVDDRDLALLSKGFSGDSFKNSFNNGTQWALAGGAGAMFLSLIPLLWGEACQ